MVFNVISVVECALIAPGLFKSVFKSFRAAALERIRIRLCAMKKNAMRVGGSEHLVEVGIDDVVREMVIAFRLGGVDENVLRPIPKHWKRASQKPTESHMLLPLNGTCKIDQKSRRREVRGTY